MPAHKLDRLSALVSRFAMSVTAETTDQANLVICGNLADSVVSQISFRPDAKPVNLNMKCSGGVPLFSARASWGGKLNPLVNALPEQIDIAVVANDQLDGPAQLLVRESSEHRCGSDAVMDRLVEVLLVRLLRTQLEAGTAQIGLLAGLADSRLAPAIVAIHDSPEASWRVESLAELAGLSVSRFAERFARLVGSTPMSYLRHWRMVLARQDIERGDRIQSVAVRYGYASTEALGRAFKRAHGDKPTAFRSH